MIWAMLLHIVAVFTEWFWELQRSLLSPTVVEMSYGVVAEVRALVGGIVGIDMFPFGLALGWIVAIFGVMGLVLLMRVLMRAAIVMLGFRAIGLVGGK